MTEVGIAAFAVVGVEVYELSHRIHLGDTRDHPRALGDLPFHLASGGVVHVELAPIVTLRVPDDLIRCGQVPPVHGTLARLVLSFDGLTKYVANVAGSSICNTKLL